MNTVALICLCGVGLLFFLNLFLFLFGKELFKGKTSFKGWKTQLIIFSLSTTLFFVYFVSTISATGLVQTASVSGEIITITNNASTEAFNYLYLLTAFQAIQLIFLVVGIINDLKLLGRQRMSNDWDE